MSEHVQLKFTQRWVPLDTEGDDLMSALSAQGWRLVTQELAERTPYQDPIDYWWVTIWSHLA